MTSILTDRSFSIAGIQAQGSRARTRQQSVALLHFLERQIDEGRIKPGERLASERELSAQFGASRNAVRTVLAELHKAGKITRKVGRGTIVSAGVAPASAAASPLDASPLELMELRLAIEPGLISSIMLHASERDLRAILECVNQGDSASKLEEWEHSDRSFHRLFVAATHNRLAIALYVTISAIRARRPWMTVKTKSTDPAKWRKYQEEHRRIAEALLGRDAIAAENAIREHLLHARAKLLDTI